MFGGYPFAFPLAPHLSLTSRRHLGHSPEGTYGFTWNPASGRGFVVKNTPLTLPGINQTTTLSPVGESRYHSAAVDLTLGGVPGLCPPTPTSNVEAKSKKWRTGRGGAWNLQKEVKPRPGLTNLLSSAFTLGGENGRRGATGPRGRRGFHGRFFHWKKKGGEQQGPCAPKSRKKQTRGNADCGTHAIESAMAEDSFWRTGGGV